MLIQKTVYIREEDIELWNKVSNKAEWIHDHLNMYNTETPKQRYVTQQETITKPIENIKEEVAKIKPLTTADKIKQAKMEERKKRWRTT